MAVSIKDYELAKSEEIDGHEVVTIKKHNNTKLSEVLNLLPPGLVQKDERAWVQLPWNFWLLETQL
jgi:hypothetical protein